MVFGKINHLIDIESTNEDVACSTIIGICFINTIINNNL